MVPALPCDAPSGLRQGLPVIPQAGMWLLSAEAQGASCLPGVWSLGLLQGHVLPQPAAQRTGMRPGQSGSLNDSAPKQATAAVTWFADTRGRCTLLQHSVSCGGGTGIFLIVNSSLTVVIRGQRATLWGSVYLDAHGEEDKDLK